MLDELSTLLAEDSRSIERDYPFRLVPRRMNNVLNSFGRRIPTLLRKPYNPAYLNPADMARLGLVDGDHVRIRSPHGEIEAIVEAESALRAGIVSMAHGFGGQPGADDPRVDGANTGRLISNEVEYDPITGIPRMGAIPVTISPGSSAGVSR
jgi:anaerobic selenocysteine-containing dehydrogenase